MIGNIWLDGSNAEYAESAVIKGKTAANITLNGAGTLNLICNSKNAVKVGTSGALTISDLTLNVTSVNHGISSDNTLAAASGTITVKASEGDAIRSDPDTVDADGGLAGTITINGGTFALNAGSDGIQAAQDLTITDGVFAIAAGNKGLKASVGSDGTENEIEDAENTIAISGGTFTLNTTDDAIHSDGYVTITGGTFAIATGDDGVHADTSLTLGTSGGRERDPDMTIRQSYEGLEAGTIYIYSGRYYVAAFDDGINAAGGSSNGSDPGGGPGGGGFNPGGGPGGGMINVYYTQDYTTVSESNVSVAYSRNGDSGELDGGGNGQVNFTIVPEDGIRDGHDQHRRVLQSDQRPGENRPCQYLPDYQDFQ